MDEVPETRVSKKIGNVQPNCDPQQSESVSERDGLIILLTVVVVVTAEIVLHALATVD